MDGTDYEKKTVLNGTKYLRMTQFFDPSPYPSMLIRAQVNFFVCQKANISLKKEEEGNGWE